MEHRCTFFYYFFLVLSLFFLLWFFCVFVRILFANIFCECFIFFVAQTATTTTIFCFLNSLITTLSSLYKYKIYKFIIIHYKHTQFIWIINDWCCCVSFEFVRTFILLILFAYFYMSSMQISSIIIECVLISLECVCLWVYDRFRIKINKILQNTRRLHLKL